jgi:hypothetical protein
MSIDTVAVLRITRLPPPETPFGFAHPVTHRGDATLINLMHRHEGTPADEAAWALRRLVGPALDAHDDPRGVLLFPEIADPQSGSYAAIVAEIEARGSGVWTELVGDDHVPLRYRTGAPDSRDGLTGLLIAALGRDPALDLAMAAELAAFGAAAAPEDAAAQARLDAALAPVAAAIGPDAAAMLRVRLMESVAESHARQQPITLDWLPIQLDPPRD